MEAVAVRFPAQLVAVRRVVSVLLVRRPMLRLLVLVLLLLPQPLALRGGRIAVLLLVMPRRCPMIVLVMLDRSALLMGFAGGIGPGRRRSAGNECQGGKQAYGKGK
jgi:hypothetical protein